MYVARGSGASTEHDLSTLVVVVPLQWQHCSGPPAWIRSGVARNVGKCLDHLVGEVVADDGGVVDEDEEVDGWRLHNAALG